MDKDKYVIVQSPTLGGLQALVNAAIEKSYIPVGGPTAAEIRDLKVWIQAMVLSTVFPGGHH
jgi:hypothetical protein